MVFYGRAVTKSILILGCIVYLMPISWAVTDVDKVETPVESTQQVAQKSESSIMPFHVPPLDNQETTGYKILDLPVHHMPVDHVIVQSFFWYSCGHCFRVSDTLTEWHASLDTPLVDLQHIPPALNSYWELMSKLYYTLEALNVIEDVHNDVFTALQVRKVNLYQRDKLKGFIKEHDISWEEFEATEKDFSVQMKVARGKQLAERYQLTGVPAVVVQGRYLIDFTTVNDPEELYLVLHRLVARLLAEQQNLKQIHKPKQYTPKNQAK